MWLSLNCTCRFYLYLYIEQNKDSACVVDPGQAARIREVGVGGNEGKLRRTESGLSEMATERLSLPPWLSGQQWPRVTGGYTERHCCS